MQTTRLHFIAPQTLACETEADVTLWIDVTYDPGVKGDEGATINTVEVLDAAEHRVDARIGTVRLDLSMEDQRRLYLAWAKRSANWKKLTDRCAQHWNEVGASKQEIN